MWSYILLSWYKELGLINRFSFHGAQMSFDICLIFSPHFYDLITGVFETRWSWQNENVSCHFPFSLTTCCCTPNPFSQASTCSKTRCPSEEWRWELILILFVNFHIFSHFLTSRDHLYPGITAHSENNYRLANRVKRPIRTSWTSWAWSALSFSPRGNDQKWKRPL